MGAEATIMGAGGVAESHGLSLLDVAKHGIRTVIKTCSPQDRLTLATFNATASTVLPLTVMDEAGQLRAEQLLEQVTSGGGTNIWNGLFEGLEALRTGAADGRLVHVMLLTDGESQERDKIVPNLLQYKQTYERLPGTISTFGFGYNIDSALLVRLASAGDGSFSFIPDAGFVGTAFVNILSNLLVTMARGVYLSLEPEDGSVILGMSGGYQVGEATSWGMRVNLGTLQYEQTKDLIIFMRVAGRQPYLTVSGSYEGVGGVVGAMPAAEGLLDVDKLKVGINLCRARYVDVVQRVAEALHPIYGSAATGSQRSGTNNMLAPTWLLPARDVLESLQTPFACCGMRGPGSRARDLRSSSLWSSLMGQAVNSLEDARALVSTVGALIEKSEAAASAQVVALLEDMKGQTTEAISQEDWYRKWGRHYVPSIMFAHRLQQCNNFKDPGVQGYGGQLFQDVRDIGDAIFNKLPAPKPSIRRSSQMASAPQISQMASAPQVSMAAYNDRYAGCIDGSCQVRLASGEARLIRDLKPGDIVESPGGYSAEVVCLVRTLCRGGRAYLVELPGGARLTPYHPVLRDGSWVFPANIAEISEHSCDSVYNLVLSSAAAVIVAGVPCVALGHGIEEGAAKHPYFGQQQAIEDVAKLPGFEAGLVQLSPGWAKRDDATGLICGMHPDPSLEDE